MEDVFLKQERMRTFLANFSGTLHNPQINYYSPDVAQGHKV